MRELVGGIPRELQQIKSASLALREIVTSPYKPRRAQSLIIIGFSSVIPEQVKASGILNNPQRIAVVDAVEQYMVALNDRVDYEGSGRDDIPDLIKETKDTEVSKKMELDRALADLPEEEQQRARENIETAAMEIEFVEDWIRKKRDTNNVTFNDVDIYRNITNAISNVALSSVIFGPGSLTDRVKQIKGMDVQSIIDKYAWVTGRHPQNEIEKGVMIAHNIAMAVQIIDDWKGRDIDKLLNASSYAVAVLRSVGDIESIAKVWLYDEKDKYIERARGLGIGKIATDVPLTFAAILELVHNKIAKSGRKHTWVRRQFANRNMGKREQDYMNRKL